MGLARPLRAGDGLVNSSDVRCPPGTRATVVDIDWASEGARVTVARVTARTLTMPPELLSIERCTGWVVERATEDHPMLTTWRDQ